MPNKQILLPREDTPELKILETKSLHVMETTNLFYTLFLNILFVNFRESLRGSTDLNRRADCVLTEASVLVQ